MQYLIQLILRYYALGLAFVLQLLCVLLIVNFNERQGDIFQATSHAFTGGMYSIKYDINQYLNYRVQNDMLAEDNARLFQMLEESQFKSLLEVDSSENPDYSQQYTYISAEVVNNSINKANNYLTINRGSSHGVRQHDGVIGGMMPIGIVVAASKHYSVVMSMLHQETRVSVSVKGKGHFGSMHWGGTHPTLMDVEAIPRHADVQPGDTIITNGYSSIFPGGLVVGIVETVENVGGSSFDHIKVKLAEDIGKLRRVYVVDNLFGTEQQELEKNTVDE